MRYFVRNKFFESFVHKKNFGLIWQVVFKLGYLFLHGRQDTSFEFEWTWRKVASDNYYRKICKQTIIKLLLTYSFQKMFFIGQNLKYVHMTYSFVKVLIFFWLTLVNIYCLEFISHYIKEIMDISKNSKGNESWKRNKKTHIFTCLWYWCWKILFFSSCRVKIP